MDLDQLDKAIISCLQEELPLDLEPYKIIANKLEIEETELLRRIEILMEKGIIRRMGAILNHRDAGFSANAMVVWSIPQESIQRSGELMATFPEVSHCYERQRLTQWPYNLFSMVHGRTKEECEVVIGKIAEAINNNSYDILYSTVELKKTSMKYFT